MQVCRRAPAAHAALTGRKLWWLAPPGIGSLRVRCSELNLAIEYEMEALALFRQLRDEVTPQRPFRVGPLLQSAPPRPARDGNHRVLTAVGAEWRGDVPVSARRAPLLCGRGALPTAPADPIPSHRIASGARRPDRTVAVLAAAGGPSIGDRARPGFAANRCGKRSRHSSCACSSGAACVIR